MISKTHEPQTYGSSTRQRLWRYGPLLFWILFISFASTAEFSAVNTTEILRPMILWFFPNLNDSQVAMVHFFMRKAGHFTEYAVLAFLAWRAFSNSSKVFFREHWFALTLFLVVVYSLLDEFHQSFVPSRTASVYDSLIDIAGGLSALMLAKLFARRAERVRRDATTT
jgi:VanZ family protein